ncbi:hypothetical protein PvNV_013 [Penaeus vannamei nudivirus]|nr:hypothetical protein PvSNPV_013 [Penaeus vannamei nucleopolyhedrovirus]
MRTFKKIKLPNFQSFVCTCNSVQNQEIPLQIENEEVLKCICKNYKTYLESRNMWEKFFEPYRNALERIIHYPEGQIKNIKFYLDTKYDDVKITIKNSLKIYLLFYDYRETNDFVTSCDVMASEEFRSFLNKHVYIECPEDDFKQADAIYNVIKSFNF